jgi:putative phage-type endonuclease
MPNKKYTSKSIKLGTATKVGNFETQSPEWHEARSKGIGGSEVGIIIGVNQWESPFTLWAKKLGKIETQPLTSEAAEWGNRLEPAVISKFSDSHPELEVFSDIGTWAHEERSWQIANPDGLIWDGAEMSILEIKTARFEDDWINGIPLSYQAQVQWYLQTFGFSKAYVAVLFSGSKYKEFELLASDFEQDVNLAAVEKFRDYLELDKQPDYDGASNTYETIRQLHPDIDPELEVELGDLYEHYSNAMTAQSEAEKLATELKSRVLDSIGRGKKGLYNGDWVVSRQARGAGAPFLVNKKA